MSFVSLGRVRSGLLQSPMTPIAIDFGVGSLKVMQLSTGPTPVIIAAASVDTPEKLLPDFSKRLDYQFELLPKLIRAGSFKGRRAACAIPAQQMFCKHLQVPRNEGADLAALVRTAVTQHLNCHPDALVYRHVEVATAHGAAGKAEVLCMAAARDLVSRLMGAVRDAKLDLVGMHPECLALLRAFERPVAESEHPDAPTLYADLGMGTTKVIIAHGAAPVFAKTIMFGGAHLDKYLSTKLGCSVNEAHLRRLAARALGPRPAQGGGVATAVEESVDLSEPLELLTDELAMCVRYHESLFPGRRVERAIFVGGEARHQPLCRHVARTLRLPAHVADPIAAVGRSPECVARGVDLEVPQPGWAAPMGVALSPTDL